MIVRALDLFCGGGGSSWGAEAAGAEIVAGVDNWQLATEIFQDNFAAAYAIDQDVNGRWLDGAFPAFGDIDLVLASPECTNHTCAKGSHPRDEVSRRTALHVLRYLRIFEPRWLVLENVVQMRSWNGYANFLASIAKDFHIRCQVLDAADFGVAQTRRRLFLIGDREQMPPAIVPTVSARRTAAQILDRQGTWDTTPLYCKSRASATLERAERAIAVLGKRKPFLIVYYGSDGAGGWQRIDRPLRTMTTLDRFGLVEWENGTPRLRMLQIPELKRAMGLTEGFALTRGTRRERVKILGNAVCPPVMESVVRTLISNCESRGEKPEAVDAMELLAA